MRANVWQLHNHAGPRYDAWLRASLAALERRILDGPGGADYANRTMPAGDTQAD